MTPDELLEKAKIEALSQMESTEHISLKLIRAYIAGVKLGGNIATSHLQKELLITKSSKKDE